jgi:hypothetical protein
LLGLYDDEMVRILKVLVHAFSFFFFVLPVLLNPPFFLRSVTLSYSISFTYFVYRVSSNFIFNIAVQINLVARSPLV